MRAKQWFFGSMVIWFAATVFAVNCFGAVPGDADGSGTVDLQDVITAIQVCAGMTPTSVHKENSVNDGNIGLAEAITALQTVASFPWYKDADGDGYSDGTTLVSFRRPSEIYYERTELIAISGDKDDKDTNVHPDTEGKWVAFDNLEVAEPGDSVHIDVPISTTEEVIIEFGVPGMNASEIPEQGDIYNFLNISDCGYTTEIGKPQLPVVRRYVAVPSGAMVQTEVLETDYRDIEGYSIYPLQDPPPDIDGAPAPDFEMDADLYQTDSFYPSEIVSLEEQELSHHFEEGGQHGFWSQHNAFEAAWKLQTLLDNNKV